MSVKTFNPDCYVGIQKSIVTRDGRAARYPSSNSKIGPNIDITPYLSEHGMVVTQKSLYQPAGVFTLVLADRPHDFYLDTLYGLVEPMDQVEIRMTRTPHRYVLQDYPIIMRGFVRSVQRTETMGANGKPQRFVVIRGVDYGLLFELIRFYKLQAYAEGKALLTNLNYWEVSGIDMTPRAPKEWIDILCARILQPFIDSFVAATQTNVTRITPKVTVTAGAVYQKGMPQGSLWDLMVQKSDPYWNELFLRDTQDEVELIHRPLPWIDAASTAAPQWIEQQGQTVALPDSEIVPVSMEAVQTLTSGRSDSGVMNLYRVDHPTGNLIGSSSMLYAHGMQTAERDTIYTNDPVKYPNSNPALYGARPIQVQAAMGWTGQATDIASLPRAEQAQAAQSMKDWMVARRQDLIALNKDNVLFEEGMARLMGDERILPGRYLRLERHNYKSLMLYVHNVKQTFVPYQRFITEVGFARGTGFIARTRSGKPYLDDGKSGVYP